MARDDEGKERELMSSQYLYRVQPTRDGFLIESKPDEDTVVSAHFYDLKDLTERASFSWRDARSIRTIPAMASSCLRPIPERMHVRLWRAIQRSRKAYSLPNCFRSQLHWPVRRFSRPSPANRSPVPGISSTMQSILPMECDASGGHRCRRETRTLAACSRV